MALSISAGGSWGIKRPTGASRSRGLEDFITEITLVRRRGRLGKRAMDPTSTRIKKVKRKVGGQRNIGQTKNPADEEGGETDKVGEKSKFVSVCKKIWSLRVGCGNQSGCGRRWCRNLRHGVW